jgi:hypothetical protein
MSAIWYFMHLSMLLHVLIDNEQQDQQRLQTKYWQNNVLKDMKMTSKRLETNYWQNNVLKNMIFQYY